MAIEITSIQFAGYGRNKITILYRGKQYSAVSTNTLATDRLKSDDSELKRGTGGYTYKQAQRVLIDFVKQENNLR